MNEALDWPEGIQVPNKGDFIMLAQAGYAESVHPRGASLLISLFSEFDPYEYFFSGNSYIKFWRDQNNVTMRKLDYATRDIAWQPEQVKAVGSIDHVLDRLSKFSVARHLKVSRDNPILLEYLSVVRYFSSS